MVSNGPIKYQNATEQTEVRLHFAVARGVLLLPSRMIINTESVVGYNNNLTRATDDMKLKKATTTSISSQACSPRKERTCPADLKMKLTIEPDEPG